MQINALETQLSFNGSYKDDSYYGLTRFVYIVDIPTHSLWNNLQQVYT